MNSLEALSTDLKTLVASAGAAVVRLEGRHGGITGGVAWSRDGTIVAARHALEEEEPVEVGLPSGESVGGEHVGSDPGTDLAVVRVKGVSLAPPAWSEEPPAPGSLVVGLSRPGRSIRAELGVIQRAAGEWRTATGGRLERYVETSLAVRPGLSGSLVVGADGRALGLATAGLARGAALAVPPATLRRVVEAILRDGSVRRGHLGIATFPVRLPPPIAAAEGQETALLVSGVEPGGPAERAGLLLGDVLLSLADARVRGPRDLAPALEPERIGARIAARILRAGVAREESITVGARPAGGGR